MKLPARVVLGMLIGIAVTSAAADPQRERIARERAAANARFDEQQRACQQRFLVTRCVSAAREEQRIELDRLRAEELQLDDARRREAAAERTRELEAKAAAQAARASEAPMTEERAPRSPRAPRPSGASAPSSGTAAAVEDKSKDASGRAAQERRNEEKFEARARAAEAHREEVERRNAERAARGKQAAPLPPPPGASAPP